MQTSHQWLSSVHATSSPAAASRALTDKRYKRICCCTGTFTTFYIRSISSYTNFFFREDMQLNLYISYYSRHLAGRMSYKVPDTTAKCTCLPYINATHYTQSTFPLFGSSVSDFVYRVALTGK